MVYFTWKMVVIMKVNLKMEKLKDMVFENGNIVEIATQESFASRLTGVAMLAFLRLNLGNFGLFLRSLACSFGFF